jgi:hypothetical protein
VVVDVELDVSEAVEVSEVGAGRAAAMSKRPELAKTSFMLLVFTAVRVYPVLCISHILSVRGEQDTYVSNKKGQVTVIEPSPGLTLLAMAMALRSAGWSSSMEKML